MLLTYLALLAVLTDRAWDGVRATERRASASPDVAAWVELVGDPVPERFRTRAVVRLDGAHVLAVATRPWSSALNVVEAGDRLYVTGRLTPLPDHEAARWHHRHVGAALAVDDVLALSRPDGALAAVANGIRSVVLSGADEVPSPERGVVAGLLVGDTRGIPEDLIDDFRAAGLSHLLAVSGANVAFVLALVSPLITRLRLKGRFALSLVVILLFAAATRFEPSVLRASAMAAVAAVSAYTGRPASGLRMLVLAVGALLLADPFLLSSVGFRLSCAACAGIILLARPIAARLPGPAPLREALGVTLAAQVGVTPVLIPVFGGVPLASIPANLLAAPLTGPLTMWGMVSGCVSALVEPLVPELTMLLQVPTTALAHALVTVARVCAGIPWTLGATGAWGLLAASGLAGAARSWWGRGPTSRVDADGPRDHLPDAAARAPRV